jgi:hypothetical protein
VRRGQQADGGRLTPSSGTPTPRPADAGVRAPATSSSRALRVEARTDGEIACCTGNHLRVSPREPSDDHPCSKPRHIGRQAVPEPASRTQWRVACDVHAHADCLVRRTGVPPERFGCLARTFLRAFSPWHRRRSRSLAARSALRRDGLHAAAARQVGPQCLICPVRARVGTPFSAFPLRTAANTPALSSPPASQPRRKARGRQGEPGDRGRCIQR